MNDRHDAETYDDRDGVSLGRIHIARTFRGDLEGTATAELLTAMTASGSAVYVAFDRIEGTLHGHRGSFVLHHRGIAGPDGSFVNDGFIVADSATGELVGLRGTATIVAAADGTHHLTLDYELEPSREPRRRPSADTDRSLRSLQLCRHRPSGHVPEEHVARLGCFYRMHG